MSQKYQTLELAVKLSDVTVFLQGAELFSAGVIEIPAGESELVLSNVASSINEQSLSVSASNGVTVLSAGVSVDHLDEDVLTELAKSVKEKLEAKKLEFERTQVQINVLEEEVKVLQANRRVAQDGGVTTVSELGAVVDFIAKRVESAWGKKIGLNVQLEKLAKEVEALENQFEEECSKQVAAAGKIVLKLLSDKATQTEIKLSYVSYDAAWVPSYDLRVDEVDRPVQLVYKAQLTQNTGIHWQGVLLTLSTGNPTQGTYMPALYPWYIRKERPYHGAPVAAGMAHEEMMHAEMADAAPRMLAKSVSSNTLGAHVVTQTQGLNIEFEIDIPYNIPCDGKSHMVMIQSKHIPAEFYYASTPKLDTDAFLHARINDWQELNLMPGISSVYFEGSYVGQGYIDLTQIKEGMELSLGREKRIVLERVEDENNQSKAGLLGGGLQRAFAYTIGIQNARPDAIKLIIRDQLPVSQDGDITVSELKLAGAKHDEKTGMLEWERIVEPSTQEKIVFSYAVKYAKDVFVEGL